MLAESWRAGLTVTTFVQLFESLAGPANTQSMKLPALRDSVVILDEPQSLPINWWKLVPRLTAMLIDQFDASVIAMTATQPELFDEERRPELFDDVPELVENPDSYFSAVERVVYHLDESVEGYVAEGAKQRPKSYPDAAASIRAATGAGDSALAICNTIESTRELTAAVDSVLPNTTDVAAVYADRLEAVESEGEFDPESLADGVAAQDGTALVHLSTRLRPVDRLRLVETARELTEHECPFVTVSTQLVEAGVDISFDRVYRDLAPMDSIVQAAGRCNRSFERERGEVTVWWLDAPDDQTKTPAAAVYNRGTALLPVTAAALRTVRAETGELSETTVARDAVEEYYRRLHEDRDVGRQSYVDSVDAARADELGRLSLIDQRRSVDVLVCRSDDDRELAEAFTDAARTRAFDTLDRLRQETKPLRVSIPVYRQDGDRANAIRKLAPVHETEEGLRRLDVRDKPSFFDQRTGFVVPESSVGYQFI